MAGVIIILSGFVLAYFIILKIMSIYTIRKNKNCVDFFKTEDSEVFENLKISSVRTIGFKVILGIPVKGIVIFSKNAIALATDKGSFFTRVELPFVLNKAYSFPDKLKMNSWNSITLEVEKATIFLGKAKVEFLIETETQEQKEKLFSSFNNWYNLV